MPKKKEKPHNILKEMKKLFKEEREGKRLSKSAEKPLRIKKKFKEALQDIINKKD